MEREEYNRIEQAAELLKALGHPVRLCIVKKLLEGGCCNVASMERCVDVTQSSVSQHLARLRAAGRFRRKAGCRQTQRAFSAQRRPCRTCPRRQRLTQCPACQWCSLPQARLGLRFQRFWDRAFWGKWPTASSSRQGPGRPQRRP